MEVVSLVKCFDCRFPTKRKAGKVRKRGGGDVNSGRSIDGLHDSDDGRGLLIPILKIVEAGENVKNAK